MSVANSIGVVKRIEPPYKDSSSDITTTEGIEIVMIVPCIAPSWLYTSGSTMPINGNGRPAYAGCQRITDADQQKTRLVSAYWRPITR